MKDDYIYILRLYIDTYTVFVYVINSLYNSYHKWYRIIIQSQAYTGYTEIIYIYFLTDSSNSLVFNMLWYRTTQIAYKT